MRSNKSKRLTLLSEAEKLALYSLPDFDDFQRTNFFALCDKELSLVLSREGISEQVFCLLQIGYFKAKQTFFRFSLQEVPPQDIAFVVDRYFPGATFSSQRLGRHEYYAQRSAIMGLFGYRLWSDLIRRHFFLRQ